MSKRIRTQAEKKARRIAYRKAANSPLSKRGPKGPSKFTEDIIGKLKIAFSNYANILEACRYARISVDAFYYNAPKGSQLYEELLSYRFDPKLKAKQTIVQGLNDRDLAWKFLKNTSPDEFAEKQIHEEANVDPPPLSDKAKEFLEKIKAKNNG